MSLTWDFRFDEDVILRGDCFDLLYELQAGKTGARYSDRVDKRSKEARHCVTRLNHSKRRV